METKSLCKPTASSILHAGLGPVANMIDINRGNRLPALSSVSTKAMGCTRYIVNNPKGGENHPNAKVKFRRVDIVTTQIQTANGQTIVLTHDTLIPAPTALASGYRYRQALAELTPVWFRRGLCLCGRQRADRMQDNSKKWFDEYDHPLWKGFSKEAEGAGHGGMDFFVDNAFIRCIKRDAVPSRSMCTTSQHGTRSRQLSESPSPKAEPYNTFPILPGANGAQNAHFGLSGTKSLLTSS